MSPTSAATMIRAAGALPNTPSGVQRHWPCGGRASKCFHTSLEATEAAALTLAQGGATLAEICSAFSGETDAVRLAFTTLSSWLSEGFLAAT